MKFAPCTFLVFSVFQGQLQVTLEHFQICPNNRVHFTRKKQNEQGDSKDKFTDTKRQRRNRRKEENDEEERRKKNG